MKLFLLIISYFLCVTNAAAQSTNTNTTTSFTSCLVSANVHNFSIAASSSSYNRLFNFSVRNLRFADTRRPVAIVLPRTKRQLRSAVVCCRDSFLTIRLRSGGHSYEGLSYTAPGTNPFAVIDLMNLNRVRVSLPDSTAWVESGATLGEIYYTVANVSAGSLAFPAGSCPTVGSGGQIAGGGYGYLARKYGLAADNVLDAVLIDSAGRLLRRSSMGDDAFWAIRGGGGGSWGAIYAWKLRLVPVPDRVTTCHLSRSMPSRPAAAQLAHKWQHVSPALPDEFHLYLTISATANATDSVFDLQFLGPLSHAVSTLARRFPELGLEETDCTETSWVESAVRFAGLKSKSKLTDRSTWGEIYFKVKSDYVRAPIPLSGLIGAFNWLAKDPKAEIFMEPYGGAMDRIPSDYVPFPHRRGNLYGIQHGVSWTEEDTRAGHKHVAWLREFYEYMARYVSKDPRAAYVNYVDLDLGVVDWSGPDRGRDRAGAARAWGEKYFLGNYDRLVRAKTAIDPGNVFSHQQSIPPLWS